MAGPLCIECNRPESAADHQEAAWVDGGTGHPFEPAPIESPRRRPDPLKVVRPMTPVEREAAPPVMGELLCWCEKPRRSHRGTIGHKFDPSGKPAKQVPPPADRAPQGRQAKRRAKVVRKSRPRPIARHKAAKPSAGRSDGLEPVVGRVLGLATEIHQLEQQLTDKLEELKQLLA